MGRDGGRFRAGGEGRGIGVWVRRQRLDETEHRID